MAPVLLACGDDHVAPGLEPSGAAEIGLPLVADDGIRLVVDDRLNQLVLVGEVVVELRAAHLGRRPDVVEGGAGDAALVNQPRRRRPTIRARVRSPLGVSLGRGRVSLTMPIRLPTLWV